MAEQLELDLGPLVLPEGDASLTIAERFDQFHDANPWIFDALVALAEDEVRRGHERTSIDMLVHVVRWEYRRRVVSTSALRVNNDYTSRYARLITEQRPDLAHLFETRRLRAA